jgi:RNase H-like domain found in reverse transcriptase
LGHRVSAAEIAPLPSRVDALQRHPQPTTVRELQGFIGAINFYRRFVPAAAKILRPLTDSLRSNPAPSSPLTWSASMQQAFGDPKAALAAVTLLAQPLEKAELALMVDASADHVGAALHQRTSPHAAWQPLGFFLKKLLPAERRYSGFDRELLACVQGIRYFRYMLEARRFTIYTDHKPLTFAIHKVAEPWSARQARHLSYVAEFSTDIRHVAGVDNVVADTLSRPPRPAVICSVPATPGSLDMAALAAVQRTCPAVAAGKDSSLKLELVHFNGVRVLCDMSREQSNPGRSSLSHTAASFLKLCMVWPTPVCGPHGGLLPPGRCGMESTRMSTPGVGTVSNAHVLRCTSSRRRRYRRLLCCSSGSRTYISTWWGRCQLHLLACGTCSRSMALSLNGALARRCPHSMALSLDSALARRRSNSTALSLIGALA